MRKLCAALATLALVAGLGLFASSPAGATGTTFGCRISPGTIFTWNQYCHTSEAASTYNAGFLVQNAAIPLSYSWSIPSGHAIYSGCGSSDNSCGVLAHQGDEFEVTVNLTYSDHTESYWSDATIDQWCGNNIC